MHLLTWCVHVHSTENASLNYMCMWLIVFVLLCTKHASSGVSDQLLERLCVQEVIKRLEWVIGMLFCWPFVCSTVQSVTQLHTFAATCPTVETFLSLKHHRCICHYFANTDQTMDVRLNCLSLQQGNKPPVTLTLDLLFGSGRRLEYLKRTQAGTKRTYKILKGSQNQLLDSNPRPKTIVLLSSVVMQSFSSSCNTWVLVTVVTVGVFLVPVWITLLFLFFTVHHCFVSTPASVMFRVSSFVISFLFWLISSVFFQFCLLCVWMSHLC